MELQDTTFIGNSADSGPALQFWHYQQDIYSKESYFMMNNCTFIENKS